ncbi:MAG: chemotaxis protein MotB, partial [Alphaproteobacteria bacterium]|nr:chemotaxis protein MotB [Alphaproteobacteria bacterium]
MEAGHNQPIIVKKIKKGGHGGHHGGAWKVAYADFVTAMMAFFLLLWLLSTTSVEQRSGIADYFTPTTATLSKVSGAGDILAGRSLADGARVGDGGSSAVIVAVQIPKVATQKDIEELKAKKEQEAFDEAKSALEKTISENPDLSDLQNNIKIDMTEEGMRIQIVDREGGALFDAGTANLRPKTRRLLEQVAKVVAQLDNDVSIAGHTDSAALPPRPGAAANDYSNWELSSDRANAGRRVLIGSGVETARIQQVVGKADQEPLLE